MIKIPNDLQSVLSASYHVNSFKGAVEELIYNSLDAGSTSIAVRVNIQENSIQVIDNGSGIKRNDFNLLGQRYTTSKFDNLTRLNSIPLTYGYRGLSLTSIIEVCREVKIVSRFQDSKETFYKIFRKGKCKEIAETTSRPSKGTTAEIYGLLYNLKIQRKSLDNCSELYAIKTLLERLSLLHVNVSFSLRDDEKNEIIFKVHKNRDIFQTLSSLFDINSNALQEIMVEKNQYKVKGFIGKRDIELKKCHWVFLNGKYVSKTILHKIINKKFMEILHIRKNKPKNKTKLTDELSNQDLPTYFLFISCPYSDYDINTDARKIIVEFKSWAQITNLVEKLIQCYSGDFKFKEITKPTYVNDKQISSNKEINTRAEVKRIMDKILAKNSKKHRRPLSQMCNGIKGKNINRKNNRIDRLKVVCNKIKHIVSKNTLSSKHQSNSSKSQKSLVSPKLKNQIIDEKAKPEKKTRKLKIENKKEINLRKKTRNNVLKSKLLHKTDEYINLNDAELSKAHKIMTENPFEKQGMVSIDTVLDIKTNKPDAFDTALQHDEARKLRSRRYFKEKYLNNQVCGINNKNIITSYDLVQTILNCSTISNNLGIEYTHDNNFQEKSPVINYTEFKNHEEILSTKLTYESHNYAINGNKNMLEKRSSTNMHFISKASRDNFLPKNKQYKIMDYRQGVIKNKKNWRSNKQAVFNSVKLGIEQSLYSIQLSNSSFNKKLHTHNSTMLYSKSFNESLDKCTNIFNTLTQKNIDTGNVGKTLDYIVSAIDRSHIQFNSNQKTYNITYSINSSNKYTKTSQTKDNNKKDILLYENNDFTPKNTKYINTNDNIFRLNDVIDLEGNDISPEILDPLTLCEIIYNARNVLDEYNNSNYQLLPNNDNLLNDDNSENQAVSRRSEKQNTESNDKHISQDLNTEEINEIFLHTFCSNINNYKENFSNCHNSVESKLNKLDGFNIQSRFTFVPKGMSPIFTNCNPKSASNENVQDEYYKDKLYKNFAQEVVETAQIFEPKIQNINDIHRNHISKVNNKMKKDNADLMFDAKSIKNAKVLGQVDCKFIVTILSGKTVTNNTSSNFLVLFDQHAVHERIRLENNLLDYFDGIVWKSVKIDVIYFKLSEDDVVLLHNHQDKLSRFGLQWSILDKNISIYAIPEAIIGKCPRQVDVVLSATKCLLSELIDALKSLKGNIPLYPQAIMNLVFSEACRYAIMFGDKLSKSDCINLIESLAKCKTPFQCAHGRPVMAVIMEMTEEQPRYKINFAKVKHFKDTRNMEFIKK